MHVCQTRPYEKMVNCFIQAQVNILLCQVYTCSSINQSSIYGLIITSHSSERVYKKWETL